MKNIRLKTRPSVPEHEDFDWMKSTTPPSKSEGKVNNKSWKKYCAKVREGWDFGIIHWGTLGKEVEVSTECSGNVYFIRDVSDHGQVREIMRMIDWKSIPGLWMGATNVQMDGIIPLYEEKKQEWLRQQEI